MGLGEAFAGVRSAISWLPQVALGIAVISVVTLFISERVKRSSW